MRKRILMIDDDRALTIAWRVRFEASGYDVRIALDGASGLRVAEDFAPDVIILDILMPGMNGFEVCRALKSHPVLSRIPVLFMSANVQDEASRQAMELGAAGFLPKPFTSGRVLEAIESAIAARADFQIATP